MMRQGSFCQYPMQSVLIPSIRMIKEEQVVDMLERRVKVVLSILNEKLKAN